MSSLQVDSIGAVGGGHVDGSGRVIQVVQAESTTKTETTASGVWVDCGAILSITPTFSNSKIYLSNSATGIVNCVVNLAVAVRLLRNVNGGGWNTVISRSRQGYYGSQVGTYVGIHYNIEYLDSPNTTLNTQYKIQLYVTETGSNVRYNDVDSVVTPSTSKSTLIGQEIAQ